MLLRNGYTIYQVWHTTISMALGETIRAEEVQHLGLMYFNDDTVEFFIFFIGK